MIEATRQKRLVDDIERVRRKINMPIMEFCRRTGIGRSRYYDSILGKRKHLPFRFTISELVKLKELGVCVEGISEDSFEDDESTEEFLRRIFNERPEHLSKFFDELKRRQEVERILARK